MWIDPRLAWDNLPAYADISETVLDPSLIWTPDMQLYNSAEETSQLSDAKAWLKSDGRVYWSVPGQVQFNCAAEGEALSRPVDGELAEEYGRKWPRGVDLTLFPFDTQLCELQYGSWAHNGG